MPKTTPDTPSNKTESAYRVLRQAILDADLLPGTPLRQSQLHALYGIGWTPLREALSRLESERLVTLQHNRGFAVAPVSLAELNDLTRARRTLELPLLAQSLQNGDAAWEDGVVLAHHRLKTRTLYEESCSREAIKQWMQYHQAFHRALVAGVNSPWLLYLYDTVMDQEYRHHQVLTALPLQAHTALQALQDATDIQHHTDLMEAALARDVERATALMESHVNFKVEVYAQLEDPAQLAPKAARRKAKTITEVNAEITTEATTESTP